MKDKFILKSSKIYKGSHDLYHKNGKFLGEVLMLEDGYYHICLELDGAWSANHLRGLADLLDDMNKEWDEKVKRKIGSE